MTSPLALRLGVNTEFNNLVALSKGGKSFQAYLQLIRPICGDSQ